MKKIRKKYGFYLLKHLGVWTLTALILLVAGYGIYYSFGVPKWRESITGRFYDGIMGMKYMLDDSTVEESRGDIQTLLPKTFVTQGTYYFDDIFDCPAEGNSLLYDEEAGEIIAQVEPCVILKVREATGKRSYAEVYEEVFLPTSHFMKRYYCAEEPFLAMIEWEKNAWRELESENTSAGYSSTGSRRILDYYVKDGYFSPGAVEMEIILRHDGEKGVRRQTLDLTPENTEGYTHYVVEQDDLGQDLAFLENYGIESRSGSIPDASLITDAKEVLAQAPTQMSSINKVKAKKGLSFVSFAFSQPVTDRNGKSYRFITYQKLKKLPQAYLASLFGNLPFLLVSVPTFLLLILLTSRLEFREKRYRLISKQDKNFLVEAMAHDLKTPLMEIGVCAENLSENLNSEKKEHYAREILDSVGHANAVMNRNLKLLEYDGRGRGLKREKLNVRELVSEVASHYAEELKDRDLQLAIDGEMSAKADKGLLEMALDNLIGNAVRYSAEGGIIRITLAPRNIVIQNSAQLPENTNLTRLWEPFVRGDESRGKGGTGMGLALAANIFDRHQWKYKLLFDGKEGIFTCKVTIPLGLF